MDQLMPVKTNAVSMNSLVANRLDEVAQILEQQGANLFRVGAYRRAATMLRGLQEPIEQIVKTEGLAGLEKLPGIGETLARFIHQLVMTGQLPMLDRLRGESDPIALLRTVPGIGRVLAEKLHDDLGIETLELGNALIGLLSLRSAMDQPGLSFPLSIRTGPY